MSLLYLVQQGSRLQKEQGRFLIQSPDETSTEVPIREVEQVLVFGNIQLTTAAISTCLYHQIPVLFLSQSGQRASLERGGGRLEGRVGSVSAV